MIKRIDIFMNPLSQYGVLNHMTKEIHDAMNRAGVNCRLLKAEHDNPKPFLDAIFQDPPECTFSLNGLLPDETGRFFCDMINIPHVACLVDSPNQFAALAQSKNNVITCPDLYATHIFRELNCKHVFFFPHGVDKNLAPRPGVEKKYDVTFLGSCIDYEAIENSWKKHYPKNLYEALISAAKIALSDDNTPYVEAFVQSLSTHVSQGELDPTTFHLMQILHELEMYIRGKERISLIHSIKDASLHLFGNAEEGSNWKKYISADQKNVTIHEAVTFEKALEIMQESKIVLNSCAWIKQGGHERIFAAMACGAVVLTHANEYMREHFEEDKEILFYHHGKWNEVNEKINAILKDEKKREDIAEKGRKKVMAHHTWDVRVSEFLKELPKVLEEIKKEKV